MKLFRKVVDERQEREMMGIERIGFWIMYFGLVAALLVQLLVLDFDIAHLSGKLTMLLIGTAWLVVGYYRKGLWDYFFNPGIKSYTFTGVIAGILNGIMLFFFYYFRLNLSLAESLRSSAIWFLAMFIVTFLLTALHGTVIKRRRMKLQQKYKDENDM